MFSCFQAWTFALARVTPAGRIEDEGDFSDFFAVPPDNLDPLEWEQMQQQQDEVRGLGSRVECFCFGAFVEGGVLYRVREVKIIPSFLQRKC